MKKTRFALFAWVLLSAPFAAGLAAEGVVVEQVPLGATGDSIMTALRQALAKQQWKVVSDNGADAIVAEKSDSDTQAKVEFMRFDQSVRYNELKVTRDFVSTGFGPGNTGNRIPVKVKTSVPKRWLTNLHDDIFSSLNAQRKAEAAQPAAQKAVESSQSAKARLEQLKELLDAKLISESEYEQKRQQILNNL